MIMKSDSSYQEMTQPSSDRGSHLGSELVSFTNLQRLLKDGTALVHLTGIHDLQREPESS